MNRLVFITILLASLSSCSNFKNQIKLTNINPKKSKLFFPAWIKNHDPEYLTGNLPIALNSPAIHDDILYTGNNRGFFSAFDVTNGRIIWEFNDGGEFHAMPSVYKDSVIYGNNQGRLFSRHYLTGKLNFVVDLGATIESKITIYKDRLFIHLRNHQVMSLDAKTGKIIWGYKRSVPYLTTLQGTSTPMVKNNIVYVGFADSYIAAFSMEEGVLLWENKLSNGTKFVDTDLDPLFYNNQIVIGPVSEKLFILNPKNGHVIHNIDIKASRKPIRYKEGLLVPTNKGELVFYSSNFEKVATYKVSKDSISSIVSFNNYFIVSTIGPNVYVLDQKKFNIVDQFNLGHRVSAVFGQISKSRKNDFFSLISSRNRLYVFKPKIDYKQSL